MLNINNRRAPVCPNTLAAHTAYYFYMRVTRISFSDHVLGATSPLPASYAYDINELHECTSQTFVV